MSTLLHEGREGEQQQCFIQQVREGKEEERRSGGDVRAHQRVKGGGKIAGVKRVSLARHEMQGEKGKEKPSFRCLRRHQVVWAGDRRKRCLSSTPSFCGGKKGAVGCLLVVTGTQESINSLKRSGKGRQKTNSGWIVFVGKRGKKKKKRRN